MKNRIITLFALLSLGCAQAWAQSARISTVAITTGVVTVTERTGTVGNSPVYVGDNLAGLTFYNDNPGIDGTPTNTTPGSPTSSVLFTLTGASIPGGASTDLHAFMGYGTLVGPPTQAVTYNDVAPLLAASSTYAALTFAAPNLYPGGPAPLIANEFYMIHHAVNGTDYLAAISPATGGGSAVLDIKPMSWAGGTAGGPASLGTAGYFALAFAAPTPTGPYFANCFYYLRTDSSTTHTKFGYAIPALVSGFLDTLDLTTATGSFGASGFTTLAFSDTAVGGYPVNQFYYLRQDSTGTGNTILGRLDTTPGNRTISDIANLGGVYKTLTFAANTTGVAPTWGSTQFFVAGAALAAGAQSISFAAIADRTVSAGSFTVAPTASSTLPLTLTVAAGSTGTATISGPVAGVFTVTPLTSGVVTLQAKQSGPGFNTNWLNQSFNVLGVPVITSSSTAAGTVGTAFTYTTTALGSPTSYAATSALPAGLVFSTTTGAISGTPTVAGITTVTFTATNAIGTSTVFSLVVTITATPVISSALTASGTVGVSFTYTIGASNSPTSYSASPLPAGVTLSGNVLSGTPTAAGTTTTTLGATNTAGTGNAMLVITIAAASGGGSAPIISSALTASGTAGVSFTYTIGASNSPTSYSASPLPAGVTLSGNVLSGTPTSAGTTTVTLGATNATGTGNATLTITIAAASGGGASAPVINSALTFNGTVGTSIFYTITATNSPTSFSASPLPPGSSFFSGDGIISGTPSQAGITAVTIGATNAIGTGSATLTFTIAPAIPVVPPAILAVLPQITTPVTDWTTYKPAQITIQPVPGVNATFNMTYHQQGTYTVGVGQSVIPGESLVTVANTTGIDLITSLMENGIKEFDTRIRGAIVTSITKVAVGVCATVEQPAVVLPGSPGATNSATVFSNVLFLYDEATAAATDQMSLEAYGIAVVENGNLVLQNTSVTNFKWRYVGALKVSGFTSTGDTQADLAAMANSSTPLGAVVLQQGNALIADQALFIFNTFQTNGASGRAENPGHNSTVYWQSPWYVYVHELSHNFGLLHDRVSESAPDNNNIYRYGFAWTNPLTVTDQAGAKTITQVGYGTIMSLWGLENIQPYLSSPTVNITYVGNYATNQQYVGTQTIGIASGQPKAADNARVMRESAVAMAGYRVTAGPPTPTTPAAVTPPTQTPSGGGGGGGAPSLWFVTALASLAYLRRKFRRQ